MVIKQINHQFVNKKNKIPKRRQIMSSLRDCSSATTRVIKILSLRDYTILSTINAMNRNSKYILVQRYICQATLFPSFFHTRQAP